MHRSPVAGERAILQAEVATWLAAVRLFLRPWRCLGDANHNNNLKFSLCRGPQSGAQTSVAQAEPEFNWRAKDGESRMTKCRGLEGLARI